MSLRDVGRELSCNAGFLKLWRTPTKSKQKIKFYNDVPPAQRFVHVPVFNFPLFHAAFFLEHLIYSDLKCPYGKKA